MPSFLPLAILRGAGSVRVPSPQLGCDTHPRRGPGRRARSGLSASALSPGFRSAFATGGGGGGRAQAGALRLAPPHPAAPSAPRRRPAELAVSVRGAPGGPGARAARFIPRPRACAGRGKGEAALCAQAAGPGWASSGRRVLRSSGRGCPARDRGMRRPPGDGARRGRGARLRRAPLVHPAAPVHLALGEPGLGEGRALRSGGRWARAPLSQGSSRSEGEGPGAPRFLSGLSSAFPRVVLCVDEAGSRGPGFRGFTHTHTFGPAPRLFSPQGRACPPPPQTGSSALLGSVRTSPLDSPFLPCPPTPRFQGGRRGIFFLRLAPGFLPPRRALGAPSGRKWGRAHPRGGACGRGAPFPAPAGPAPLPLVLAPRSAGLQPPGRDAGEGTLTPE